MPKRARSPATAPGDPAENVKPASVPSTSLVEEVVVVEETSTVLVRFPCFDFFRTVHMCERSTPSSSPSSTSFAPESVHFVPDSLATDHPILVLDPCTDKEMIFGCSWAEVCLSSGAIGTNRAVVHLAEPSARDTNDEGRPSSALADGTIPSLLGHVAGGVSADERRVQRFDDAARAQEWEYDLVAAPAAVLVAERLR